MRRGHIGILIATAIAASACFGGGSAEPKSTPITTLIRPSASIGPVTIGESRTKVEAVLGRGTTEALGDDAASCRREDPLPERRARGQLLEVRLFQVRGHPIVLWVVTQSSRYHTRSGIGIGSPINHLADVVPLTCRGQFAVRSCDVGTSPHAGPAMTFRARDGHIDRISLIAVSAPTAG